MLPDASRLSNPYESPRHFFRVGATILYGFGGALIAYVLLTILANMESWQFYTIRCVLTGETSISRITTHWADDWIVGALFVAFIGGGTVAGLWKARRKYTRRRE